MSQSGIPSPQIIYVKTTQIEADEPVPPEEVRLSPPTRHRWSLVSDIAPSAVSQLLEPGVVVHIHFW
jgi:hypothetical protein